MYNIPPGEEIGPLCSKPSCEGYKAFDISWKVIINFIYSTVLSMYLFDFNQFAFSLCSGDAQAETSYQNTEDSSHKTLQKSSEDM
jgi:hypothetical protein